MNGGKLDLILEKTTRNEREGSQPFSTRNQCTGHEQTTNTSTSTINPAIRIASVEVDRQSDSIVAIQFQENLFRRCTDDCNCICHLRSRTWRRSSLLLQSAIGFLTLHYNGLMLLRPVCSSIHCKNFSSKTFKVTFCFPRWLLMKAAHVLMQSGPFGSPAVSLTLQRRTQEFAENSIYRLAESGNLEGVISAIMSRIADPTDAADSNGYTALHVRESSLQYAYIFY